MKTKVESLDDLKAERARLSNEVQLSQVHIQKDLGLIKKEIRPVHHTVNFLGNFLKNKNNGVLGMGVNFAADLLLRRTLLARANPIVRWVVPVLFRNMTGNLLAQSSSKVSEAAVKALTWVKEKTDDPQARNLQPGGTSTSVVATPVPRKQARPSKPLAWHGLNAAEKLVRWVKDKTADRADVVETVRVPRRSRIVEDAKTVEYLD